MKFKLVEGTTTNNYKRLSSQDETCAIVSACIDGNSERENYQSMTKLKSYVRNNLKLGYNQFVSKWVDNGEVFDEWSILIPKISYDDAIKLGQMFNQKSIIFNDTEQLKEICTTPFNNYQIGDIIRIFCNTGNHILNIELAKEILGGKKSGPVSIPMNGSNIKAFSLKDNEDFNLYEVFDPKASTFQSEYTFIKLI